MPFNPSKAGEPLSAPTNGRSNTVNDPGYENKVGYYPYDLSHTEILAPLFGQVTPSMHLITNPGDRHVVHDDAKIILNQIQGNFLNKLNQYTDHFFVSNRTMFPNNWDKLIPNPVKGDDLPNSARPVVPIYAYFYQFFHNDVDFSISYYTYEGDQRFSLSNNSVYEEFLLFNRDALVDVLINDDFEKLVKYTYGFSNLTFVAYLLSRGQLFDYLGIQFDNRRTTKYEDSLQYQIDRYFDALYRMVYGGKLDTVAFELDPADDTINMRGFTRVGDRLTRSQFRDQYMSAYERGRLFTMILNTVSDNDLIEEPDSDEYQLILQKAIDDLSDIIPALYNSIDRLLVDSQSLEDIDASVDFNANGRAINISKCLAYQLSVAEFYTNDSVDNIYTAELYMQLLRACMFPSFSNRSSEPTFDYNGVPTEYDYISYGGFYTSLVSSQLSGENSRRFIVGSLLFVLRRSLRYGDYFTTGRTRMLAIGQLSVPVSTDENSMSVNPVDITLGLVSQRFFNAANRIGNKPLAYYASINGVTPSDLPSKPRYVGHRQIELNNQLTNNTAEDQGKQTTNLVGFSDDKAMDVFIDDYGILLSLVSYDVLPIYNSGIDCDNYLSDRFEFFNPMMQNIGDQPIRLSELVGDPSLFETTFAYTVRNKEYKYKLSKAHGVTCYNLPGFVLKFPTWQYDDESLGVEFMEKIDPDFIRDKPSVIDSIVTHATGTSPGDYYHFIVSMHNSVKSSRLIQRAPGILF